MGFNEVKELLKQSKELVLVADVVENSTFKKVTRDKCDDFFTDDCEIFYISDDFVKKIYIVKNENIKKLLLI